jgi:hypothetical protein
MLRYRREFMISVWVALSSACMPDLPPLPSVADHGGPVDSSPDTDTTLPVDTIPLVDLDMQAPLDLGEPGTVRVGIQTDPGKCIASESDADCHGQFVLLALSDCKEGAVSPGLDCNPASAESLCDVLTLDLVPGTTIYPCGVVKTSADALWILAVFKDTVVPTDDAGGPNFEPTDCDFFINPPTMLKVELSKTGTTQIVVRLDRFGSCPYL